MSILSLGIQVDDMAVMPGVVARQVMECESAAYFAGCVMLHRQDTDLFHFLRMQEICTAAC